MYRGLVVVGLGLGALGCEAELLVDPQTLKSPEACASCHPQHYLEWSGSMHAYASVDPIFLAMNRRGQRETNGELGDFCIRCHAPLALAAGATTDGLNLEQVPKDLQGVNCYFCHQIDAVEGTHNAAVRLANDDTMRGGLLDPMPTDAHRSQYAATHDRNRPESSALCGGCHDIVTPAGVAIERTFAEWNDTIYSSSDLAQQQTCGTCHMPGRTGPASTVSGSPIRRLHGHATPGVDLALIPFPNRPEQRAAVQRALDTVLFAELCVERSAGAIAATVRLENLAAGHSFPSGAAQDRRAWVEIVAYVGTSTAFASGHLADDVPLSSLEDDDLLVFGDHLLDERGERVTMFWDARDFESNLLKAPTALSPLEPGYIDTHVSTTYLMPSRTDRVQMRVRLRPVDLDVIDSLIETGDLDPAFRSELPTFTLHSTVLEWDTSQGFGCIP